MKYVLVLSILFSCFLVSAPMPVMAQDEAVIEKTFCAQAIGFTSMDEMRLNLETNAKRLAVNEFFGELISASTAVENLVVTSDQIQASSLGLIRISGSTSFFNGANFGEVCASIEAYVTAADRAQFVPVAVSKRLCLSNDDLSANSLTALVRGEAVIQALYEYDARLEAADRTNLPALVQRITYSEAGFLADTATYCATMTGYVTPVEVLAFGLVDEEAMPSMASGSPRPTVAVQESVSTQASAGWITLEDRIVEDCTSELEFGQIVNCEITNGDEKHDYTFEAEPDDKFWFMVVRTSGDLAPGFDVHDRNGDVIGNGNCYDQDPKAAVAGPQYCYATRSGTHKISVFASEEDTTGTYQLSLQRINNYGNSNPIEFEFAAEGAIEEPTQIDVFTFSAEADDRFTITVSRTSGDLAPSFLVRDRNGDVVGNGNCYDQDAKEAAAGPQYCYATRSGLHSIQVYSSEEGTYGTYRVTIGKEN